MTDLEITRLCAEAMGYKILLPIKDDVVECNHLDDGKFFDPIHDDAQAMALVKKMVLSIDRAVISNYGVPEQWGWRVMAAYVGHARSADLNRAICECVAKMQASKA